MKLLTRTICGLTLATTICFSNTASAADLTGAWSGVLEAAGQKLTVVFNFKNDAGSYTATMDVPAQGANGIVVDSIDVSDGAVTLAVAAVGMTYSGKLSDDGHSIDGTYSQSGLEVQLRLERGYSGDASTKQDTLAAQNRPQMPKPPFPYSSEEVFYENSAAEGVTLAGTLLIPEGKGPFPAVVFITGSGPTDRDETMAGHKVFLVVADYLSRRGIATLRFDDRGTAESTGDYKAATSYDFADDALAGVAFLKTRSEIDPHQIGLIGHSEGGLIAPIAATKSGDVAFAVLLAGPAIPGEQLILKQMEDILRTMEVPEDTIARNVEVDKKLYAIMKSEPDEEKAAVLMRELLDARPDSDKNAAMLGTESIINSRNNVWWRAFLAYDPVPTLASLDVPVLALFCEYDINVLPSLNVPSMRAAFEQTGNSNATIIEFPGLNHLFQHTDGVKRANYGEIEETFSPEALKVVGDWIAETAAGDS